MTQELSPQEKADAKKLGDPVFTGRIDILYALGRHYLSLPFAVVCVPATLMAGHRPSILPLIPLMLLLVVVIAAEQLTTAYKKRPPETEDKQHAHFWAARYTFFSAISGACWGVAALFWFVPNSFPAQAYLALAFLGMTATEFIARSAHRPAYIAHTVFALAPLVGLLVWQGGIYADCTALLTVLFATVLISYCSGMGRLLDESIRLRNENAQLVVDLRREKVEAIRARDQAEASARAKASFIANMSHELRTPLNALLGMAQLLERADLAKQQRDHVKVMLQAGRGLQTLIEDVIALTKDDIHQPEDEDCDPVQAARAVARLLQPRAWEKQLHLTLSAAPGVPRVAADPRRVRQVLLKLADNALKFTDHGLVDIRLDLSDDRQSVRFCVSDTGPGVAPDAATLLFNPFSPGDSSYARQQQNGAGLGLAVAKRVVEQAGGKIGFSSKPGEGAHFFFSLPVSNTMDGSVTEFPESETQAAAPTGLSLLLYLPLAAMSEAVAHFLEPFGNRVIQAVSLAEAQRCAASEHFDAIITGAGDADMLAAAPGAKVPVIAILLRGNRVPSSTTHVMRWPVEADQFYRVLDHICQPHADPEADTVAAIDPVAFHTLEKSVGVKALVEILQCYIVTSEQLTNALAEACAEDKWDEAARLAQDIIGAAGGLGLSAVTQAAREFTKLAREGESRHQLRNAAQTVVGEHVRVKQALVHLYPDAA